jgi:hypothetical protein
LSRGRDCYPLTPILPSACDVAPLPTSVPIERGGIEGVRPLTLTGRHWLRHCATWRTGWRNRSRWCVRFFLGCAGFAQKVEIKRRIRKAGRQEKSNPPCSCLPAFLILFVLTVLQRFCAKPAAPLRQTFWRPGKCSGLTPRGAARQLAAVDSDKGKARLAMTHLHRAGTRPVECTAR